jgi:hypothetical protein
MMATLRTPAYLAFFAICIVMPEPMQATQAKLDADTCSALRLEQIKFRQSGILDDINKGPGWAKANLSPDRLREVEHYLTLDEQVKFGCRDAKLSPAAEKASEAARRIEFNSDADPTVPLQPAPEATGPSESGAVSDPPKPGVKEPGRKQTSHTKRKSADPKAQTSDKSKKPAKSKASESAAAANPPPEPAAQSGPESTSGDEAPTLPAFGFGETVVLPHSSP